MAGWRAQRTSSARRCAGRVEGAPPARTHTGSARPACPRVAPGATKRASSPPSHALLVLPLTPLLQVVVCCWRLGGLQEVAKVARDVKELGLNVLVFAEWYHVDSMMQMKFFDDNTRSWWTPVTGALWNLLRVFHHGFPPQTQPCASPAGASGVRARFEVVSADVGLAAGAGVCVQAVRTCRLSTTSSSPSASSWATASSTGTSPRLQVRLTCILSLAPPPPHLQTDLRPNAPAPPRLAAPAPAPRFLPRVLATASRVLSVLCACCACCALQACTCRSSLAPTSPSCPRDRTSTWPRSVP